MTNNFQTLHFICVIKNLASNYISGICPPILCGTPAGIQQPPASPPGTGSQSEPTSTDGM